MLIVYCLQLPRIEKPCPNCNETEAVFFQSQQRTAETGMVSTFEVTTTAATVLTQRSAPQKLYFVCCRCGSVWQ